ncbi:hypothetical protein KR054_010564 [Drosophila jambulina]|nr:hypothetical protein KR054_010564 [Drosophila jambulina]
MPVDQITAKLAELTFSDIEEIKDVQSFSLESSVEEERQKQETTINKDVNLTIGGSISIPDEFPSFQVAIGLDSGNSITVQKLEICKEPPKQKNLLQKSTLQGLPQETSSAGEWKRHFNNSNNVSNEDTFSGSWHNYKTDTRSKSYTTVKKLAVKRQPLKHKDLLQKPKLSCHQVKAEANSSEWVKSILNNQEENSNWVRTKDIIFGFESKQFPDTENVYDMKALTDECENIERKEKMARNSGIRSYDFGDLIHECKNLEGSIYETRIPPYGSRYQNCNEVNANELAGYLDNMLHIPREMSVMAKTMYT